MKALGQLWLAGIQIDWNGVHAEVKHHRVSLPTYPFQRKRYWIDPAELTYSGTSKIMSSPQSNGETASDESTAMVHVANSTFEGAPRDGVEQSIAKIWENLLGVDQVRYYDDFFELGGSSLLALSLFAQISETFGKNLPLSVLFEAPTVEQLAETLREKDWSAPWSLLVEIQKGEGSKPPFFFIHAAGGNILIYRDLAHHLGPDQPVYGIQAQGLGGEEPFIPRIEDMASRYLKEVQSVQPEGPYYFGGYCMGGTVALEMAKRIQAQGHDVNLLAFFETYNWVNMPRSSTTDKIYYIIQKLEFHFRNFLLLDLQGKWKFINEKAKVAKSRSGMWYETFVTKLGRDVQKSNGRFVPLAEIWDINERAPFNYTPGVYPGQITFFQPIKEYAQHKHPGLDWEDVAEGGVDTRIVPAYPAGMMVEPFVEQLGVELKECIRSVTGEETESEK